MAHKDPEKRKAYADAYNPRYHAENREAILKKMKEYRERNAEKLRQKRKEKRERNPEEARKKDAENYLRHREAILARVEKYRRENLDTVRTAKRIYRAKNPGRWKDSSKKHTQKLRDQKFQATLRVLQAHAAINPTIP